MKRYDLTDFERSVIEPLLPNKLRGVPRVDDRRVLKGILWVQDAVAIIPGRSNAKAADAFKPSSLRPAQPRRALL